MKVLRHYKTRGGKHHLKLLQYYPLGWNVVWFENERSVSTMVIPATMGLDAAIRDFDRTVERAREIDGINLQPVEETV